MTNAITIDNLYFDLDKFVGYQTLATDLLEKTPDPKVASEKLVKLTAIRSSYTSACTLFTGNSYIPLGSKLNICETLGVPGLQVRMVLAIAYMAGYNPSDEEVKTFLSGCYASALACEAVRPCARKFGFNTATYFISSIPGKALTTVNKHFGHRVLSKNGHTSDIKLMGLACVGGMIASATIDAGSTYAIGCAAIRTFFNNTTSVVTTYTVK